MNNIINDINLLIEWTDKSLCYSWLHNHAYHTFSRKDKCYTIPIIILTTIAGTASFAHPIIPNDIDNLLGMCFGGLTIFSGLLTAIKKFLNISELAESHRISRMNWEKLYREIKIELSRIDNIKHNMDNEVDKTINIESLIDKFKNNYNHLMETSPGIPENSINEFKKEFSYEKFENLQKPEICGDLEHTDCYYIKFNEK